MMGNLPRNPKYQLQKSKFRSRFYLNQEDQAYIQKVGWTKIESHAYDFIQQRLAPSFPRKDGKQTPFKGHPVFKAQHATAICCRGCLMKWYGINKGQKLSESIIASLVDILMDWIRDKAALHAAQSPVLISG